MNVSIVAYWQGALDQAHRFVNEGLAIHRELDDRMGAAYALDVAGMVDYKRGGLAPR